MGKGQDHRMLWTLRIGGIAAVGVVASAEMRADEKDGLVAEIYKLPRVSFVNVEKDVADVAPALREYGFEIPEGGEATFQKRRGLLFMRSTRKDVNRMMRTLEDIVDPVFHPGERREVRFVAEAFAYRLDPGAVAELAKFVPTPAGLEAIPKERLRILSRQTILTMSGMRAKAEAERDEPVKEDGATPLASLEIDPVIGVDGNVIDLNFLFVLTQPIGEERVRNAMISTAISLRSG